MNITDIISVRAMKKFMAVTYSEDPKKAYKIMDKYFDGAFTDLVKTSALLCCHSAEFDAFVSAAFELFQAGTEKGLRSIQNALQCEQTPRRCREPICPYCQLFDKGVVTEEARPQMHLAIDPEILLRAVQGELQR